MYPQGELKLLAWRTGRVRKRIARERVACATAMADITRPLAWFDRVRAQWGWIAPLLGMAVGRLGLGKASKGAGFFTRAFGAVVRWGPTIMSVIRGFRSRQA